MLSNSSLSSPAPEPVRPTRSGPIRLVVAAGAVALLGASIVAGPIGTDSAAAALPAGVTFEDISRCSGGDAFVGVRLENPDPSTPADVTTQVDSDGVLASSSHWVVPTDLQVGRYVELGHTARVTVTDDDGLVVYDSGDVDPCADVHPVVWETIDCTETEMTLSVQVSNLEPGQSAYVERTIGNNYSSNLAVTDPYTITEVVGPMKPVRMWVTVGPDTVYDSGLLYLTADGSCAEPVPLIEDGPAVSLSSACTESGATLALAIDGTGDPVTYSWSTDEELITEATESFGPGAVVTLDVAPASQVWVHAEDAWGRSLLNAGPLAVTHDDDCTGAPVEAVTPVAEVTCVAGAPVAELGVRNDGNVTVDPSVSWTVDGVSGSPDEDIFENVAPGEERTVTVPVDLGIPVEVTAVLSGGGHDLPSEGPQSTATAVAPEACAPVVPVVPDGPDVPEVPESAASGTPAPAAPPAGQPGVQPVTPAPTGAAPGAEQSRSGALPRTGTEPGAMLAAAVGLIAAGFGIRSRARRS